MALFGSGGIAALFTIAWLVLNQFRREYYNSAIEGSSAQQSPYWTVIHVQKILEWPIKFALCFAVLSVLFEFAHFILAIARKISSKQRPTESNHS